MNSPQCLTGGSNGGVHCTDVTNASRTMLFNIHTMQWDPELCRFACDLTSSSSLISVKKPQLQPLLPSRLLFRYFDVPIEILPAVRSSSEIYGWMVSLADACESQAFGVCAPG